MLEKQQKHYRRHKRVRAKVEGTSRRPRLCVFRSMKHIYVQLIDDEKGRTIAAASDLELRSESKKPSKTSSKPSAKASTPPKLEKNTKTLTGKVAIAYEVGKLIASKGLAKNIKEVVFDRAGFKYHGRVKAIAEGAREGGLKF